MFMHENVLWSLFMDRLCRRRNTVMHVLWYWNINVFTRALNIATRELKPRITISWVHKSRHFNPYIIHYFPYKHVIFLWLKTSPSRLLDTDSIKLCLCPARKFHMKARRLLVNLLDINYIQPKHLVYFRSNEKNAQSYHTLNTLEGMSQNFRFTLNHAC